MSACKLVSPEFRDVGNGHFVACHKYDKEIMANMKKYDEELEKQEEEARLAAEKTAREKILKKSWINQDNMMIIVRITYNGIDIRQEILKIENSI